MNKVGVERSRKIQSSVLQPNQTDIATRSVGHVNVMRFIISRGIRDGHSSTNPSPWPDPHRSCHVARQNPAAKTVGCDDDRCFHLRVFRRSLQCANAACRPCRADADGRFRKESRTSLLRGLRQSLVKSFPRKRDPTCQRQMRSSSSGGQAEASQRHGVALCG
jgi:hypothetical protein